MIQHHDIVTAFIAAYNSGNAARIAGLFPAGGWQEDVAPSRMNDTPERIVSGLAPFFQSVPDAHWVETERIVAGSSIVVMYNLTGHLQTDLGPFKARGQSISHPGVFVLRLRDGQLFSAQDFWDPQEFGRQVDMN